MMGLNRRRFLRTGTAVVGASLAGGSVMPCAHAADAALPRDLISAARREGALNLIALSHAWAFEPLMTTFAERFGVKIDDFNPEGNSAEELQAIRSLRHANRGPDCLDLSPSFAVLGAKQALLHPYKVATWDTIPADAKDPHGMWAGDYFGIVSFAVNTKVVANVPQTWQDLLRPEYKGMVAMDGSPVSSGSAFAVVLAASLANGGSFSDVAPGVEFFGKLSAAGNMNPAAMTEATLVSGQTPISLRWDYLNLASRDNAAKMVDIKVVVPENAPPYGAYYCQAISAYAPHPNAAKLWQEFLYSDEGQLGFLAAYAHPMRFNEMFAAGKIPAAMLAKLPSPAAYKQVRFATLEQIDAMKKQLGDLWPRVVKI